MLKNSSVKTGVMFIAVSSFFAHQTLTKYDLGTSADMGPGYFPMLFSALLALVGVMVLLQGFREPAESGAQDWLGEQKTAGLIIGGMILFALLLMPLGFLLSSLILLTMLVMSLHRENLKRVLVFSAILILASHLLFSKALGLHFPFLPMFVKPWIS